MPHSAVDELPPLSDEDVNILYNIVTLAQSSSDPPFRALFAAYDAVLAENGISSDHDQIYFRFLLRMGGERALGSTLFEKFKTLLGSMGIQIEVDPVDDNIDEITRHFDDFHVEGAWQRDRQTAQAFETKRPTRRASFESVHNINGEGTRRTGHKGPAKARRSNSQASVRIISGPRPASRSSTRAAPIGPGGSSLEPKFRGSSIGSRQLTNRISGQAVNHNERFGGPISNGDDHGEFHYPMIVDEHGLHNLNQGSPKSDFSLDQAHNAFHSSSRDAEEDGVYNAPQKLFYKPSLVQMDNDAEIFLYQRSHSGARKIIQKWCQRTFEWQRRRYIMEAAAQSRDSDTLVRQAFEQWRAALHQRRQALETERFFDHLDRRATKARNLFLLTKAFTHWAQSASDEVARTSVARRHILRTKYFNAWRDITAVNELKVRRQALKKFFHLWRHRTEDIAANNVIADDTYRRNLMKKVYWRWFWGFCDRRAPLWKAAKLRTKYFNTWVEKAQETATNEARALVFREQILERKALSRWAQRLQVVRQMFNTAEQWHRHKLLWHAFHSVEIQAKLAPQAMQLSSRVDSTLAHRAIMIWNEMATLSRQAVSVDRLRIMRNAWTDWNDQLRLHALTARIDDRVVLQALYKWVVAARYSLLQRVIQGKLKRAVLAQWALKASAIRASLEQAQTEIVDLRKKNLLQYALARWHSKAQSLRDKEAFGTDLYEQHLAQHTLKTCLLRLQHVQQLNRWAQDACFYILATDALKKWQAAMVQNKRLRRREAYVTLRVRVKKSMAQRALSLWRNKWSEVNGRKRQAEQVHENHLMVIGTQFFDTWKANALSILEFQRQAENICETHMVRRKFHLLLRHYQLQVTLDERARSFNAEMTYAIAGALLRKLNWRLFQIKRQEETADSLRQRNEKKHWRNMIRYWAERTALKRGGEAGGTDRTILRLAVSAAQTSPKRPPRQEMFPDQEEDDVVVHAENGTNFEEDFVIDSEQLGVGTTPLPGYLRTPSRRTARAKVRLALVNMTPATAPPLNGLLGITPFERKLRAQYPGSARRGGRATVAFDAGAKPKGFDDIPETSPIVGV